MQNISNTLKEPVRQLAVNAAAVTTPESLKLADQADVLVRMIDEIQLANMLKMTHGRAKQRCSPLQDLIDGRAGSAARHCCKGLQLLINNHLSGNDERWAIVTPCAGFLLLLIQYAVTTTARLWVKLRLKSSRMNLSRSV